MPTSVQPGARWLRSDLHVHTPFDRTKRFQADTEAALSRKASGDSTGLKQLAFEFFEACRSADLQLVAVTDHNSVAGYETFLPFLEEWRSQTDFPLTLLPGLELTVGGERNFHILLIAAADTPARALDEYLVGLFDGRDRLDDRGQPQSCQRSLLEFLRYTTNFLDDTGRAYLLIPAHINRNSGIDGELRSSKPSTWDAELGTVLRERAFAHRQWSGFQVRGKPAAIPGWFALLHAWAAAFFYGKTFESLTPSQQDLIRQRQYWPLVEASDPNCSGDIGKCHTWLKMEAPDVEGIRLALLDPESRLRTMDQGRPLETHPIITRVSIHHTDFVEDLEVPFTSSLNTLIGGRGSGKSALIECIRYALDRARPTDFEDDEQEISALVRSFLRKKEVRDYGETQGLLLPSHEVSVDLEIAGHRYRITRSSSGETFTRDPDTPESTDAELEIRTLISPRILSQRHIAHIARDPAAQRRELDALLGADHQTRFAERAQSLGNQIEQLQARRHALQDSLALLPARRTELQKIQDSIDLLEKRASTAIVKRHELLEDENRWIQATLDALNTLADLNDSAATDSEDTIAGLPQHPPSPSTSWIGDTASKVNARIGRLVQAFRRQAASLRALSKQIENGKGTHWEPGQAAANQAYTELKQEMKTKGVAFAGHERLGRQRATLTTQLRELKAANRELKRVQNDITQTITALVDLHTERHASRCELAKKFEDADADIRLQVIPFGDQAAVLSNKDAWFAGAGLQDRDWQVLVDFLFSGPNPVPDKRKQLVTALVSDIRATLQATAPLAPTDSEVAKLLGQASGQLTGHLYNALLHSDRIQLDAMERYVPDDWVLARVRDPEGTFKPIEQGSFGSRSTAVLSILLAGGDQPLIIDQPEDDLDNQYVYNVVVSMLRRAKFSRQIVIATHNANIPVNGDAELIIALDVDQRLGVLKSAGSIDRTELKEAVSMIMEGSPEAFRLRHERYGY